MTINPTPIKDDVIELDVVVIITIVTIDFVIVNNPLHFFDFFFALWFLSLKYVIISLILLIELLKLLTSFNFFH